VSAAGDALHRTTETMWAFRQMGRPGWDGGNGDANIIIESGHCASATDCGTFLQDSGGSPELPPTPVVAVAPADDLFNIVASLDLIAHEWGHGVIYSTANFNLFGPNGLQLHEGFADVIGQMVEKLREPAGWGTEQSNDWHVGEDASFDGAYLRSGSIDDGDPTTHRYGSNPVNNAMHALDAAGSDHDRGNMLNVVYRLLSDGGYNPICDRPGWTNGCVNVPSLGFDAASRILFDTVQFYTPSNTRWEDLPEYASFAAFMAFSNCCVPFGPPYNADVEQNAVNMAFTAIGYPRLTPPFSW